jgi:5-methylcytosine-specific restriction protein A
MAQYNRYQRDPHTDERYGKDWRHIRRLFLDEHPFCEMCRKDGIAKVATMVHHIKPVREGGSNDEENLMALCKSCHSRLHASDGSRWGK